MEGLSHGGEPGRSLEGAWREGALGGTPRWDPPWDPPGRYGSWYVGVPELVQTFGKEVVRAKLTAYAAAQAAARTDAINVAEEAPAAGEGHADG